MWKCTLTTSRFTIPMDSMLYAHKSYISNNFKAAISEYKAVLHCEGYDYEQDPEDITNPLPDNSFTRILKLLSRPDGFMMYGRLGIDFFSTSELLYPKMNNRLRLIRAKPNFYIISDNPNVSLGIVDCSLYTRRIALKDDYHKKRMDVLAYVLVEYNYLETLAKTIIIPARQNQFIQENIFNNAPIRRVAIAMNTNSAFTGSFTKNPFWYQQCDVRQIRIFRGGQPIVDFDTADNCHLYVTTMKAMNFQDDIPSILKRKIRDDEIKNLKKQKEKHDYENILKSLKIDNEYYRKNYKFSNKKKILLKISEISIGAGSTITVSTLSHNNPSAGFVISSSTGLLTFIGISITN